LLKGVAGAGLKQYTILFFTAKHAAKKFPQSIHNLHQTRKAEQRAVPFFVFFLLKAALIQGHKSIVLRH
jgi:hypothetical protein